jgi:hypothetical protein
LQICFLSEGECILVLVFTTKDVIHQEKPHSGIEFFVFFREEYRDLVDEVIGIGDLCLIQDVDRIIALDFSYDDPHTGMYILR